MVVVLVLLAGAVTWAIAQQGKEGVVVQGPFRVTMYTEPRHLHVGEALVAFRIQDRQFRILTGLNVDAQWRRPGSGQRVPLPLKAGQGKDYRNWITITSPGKALFWLTFDDGQGHRARLQFQQLVAPKPGRQGTHHLDGP